MQYGQFRLKFEKIPGLNETRTNDVANTLHIHLPLDYVVFCRTAWNAKTDFKKLKKRCHAISFITIDVTGGEKSKRPWAIEQCLKLTVLNKPAGLLEHFSNDCRKCLRLVIG